MKRIIITFFLTISFISIQAQIEWRNDRTGIYSSETGLLKSWPENGPVMLWFYDGLGDGFSSPAIASGKIYITGMTDEKGYLYVFDLNGKLLNKKMYANEWSENYVGARATPVINNGKVYLMSGRGDLVCLDEKSLHLIWKRNIFIDFDSKNINWGFTETPLIVGDMIITTPGGEKHNIVALNRNNGQLIWSSPAKGGLSAYCSPLYIGDQPTPLVVTMTAGNIVALNAVNGQLLWWFGNKNTNSIHANTPLYHNNMILYTSTEKGATMLRLSEGGKKAEKVWHFPGMDNMMGGLVKIGDFAYSASSGYIDNQIWYCLDWMTGQVKFDDRRLATGVSIVADGMLYCYTQKGEMALVNPTPVTFDIISQFRITKGTGQHWAHPVIYQGVLYVRHGDCLMAYKIK